jgi:hypothetical protein
VAEREVVPSPVEDLLRFEAELCNGELASACEAGRSSPSPDVPAEGLGLARFRAPMTLKSFGVVLRNTDNQVSGLDYELSRV